MNIVVVDKNTYKVLASITDTDIINSDDVEVISYGDTSPIFEDRDGTVYLKANSFEIKLADRSVEDGTTSN